MAATITIATPQFHPQTPKIGSVIPKTVFFSVNVENLQISLKQTTSVTCGHVAKLECCKGSLNMEEEEEEEEEEEKEWIGIKKLGGKCKESVGMVELLECLEKEAIMGEDHGKEPTDYNRRALIFDKSSKVFQALKQTAD